MAISELSRESEEFSKTSRDGLNETVKERTELSDSDYPPVYGTPYDSSYGSSCDASPLDNMPGFTKPPAVAIVDNEKVWKILRKEGYTAQKAQVKALNFFHSPIDVFQYALYYFGTTDFFIVLMINKRKRSIYGYHILDLTQEYSLSEDLANRMKAKDIIL
ncbi:MAG: hypothetical protein ACRBCI_02345 [Cellvibrionaceae bacterium]